MAITKYRKEMYENLENEMVEKYPILYTGHTKPLTESLMAFGFMTPITWMEHIDKLSLELETLNVMFYPKYRTRIEATEVKEKFAELSFYYDVMIDPPKYLSWISNSLRSLVDFMNEHINYDLNRVIDKPEYVSDEWYETTYDRIQSEQFSEYNEGYDTSIYKTCDGKWYKLLKDVHHCEKSHIEPKKNKILYWLSRKLLSLSYDIETWKEPTHEQQLIANRLQELACEKIRKYSDKCYHTCSTCGKELGTMFGSVDEKNENPVCVTRGYYLSYCKECAAEQNLTYTISGVDGVWQHGKLVDENHDNVPTGTKIIPDDEKLNNI